MESAVLVSSRAKLKPGAKGPAVDGLFAMTPTSFSWEPTNPSAAARLDVPLATIKSHRWSKETPTATTALLKFSPHADPAAEGGYMFVFSSFADRDKARDVYSTYQAKYQSSAKPATSASSPTPSTPPTPPIASSSSNSASPLPFPPAATSATTAAAAAAAASAAAAAAAASGVAGAGGLAALPLPGLPPGLPGMLPGMLPGELLDPEELQRRQKLLQADAKLRRLHQDLVMTAALTETEFWAARKSNTITFNLTPQIIQQIFAEKPAVHRAFMELVPARMPEKDFWTKYYRAEFLFRTKNVAAAEAEAADDEELALFVRDDEQLRVDARRKVQRVDPTLNVLATAGDDYSNLQGHGILRDGRKEASAVEGEGEGEGAAGQEGAGGGGRMASSGSIGSDGGGGARLRMQRTIFRDINQHAAVVLQGRILDEDVADTRELATAVAEANAQRAGVPAEQAPEEEWRRARARNMPVMADLRGDAPPAVIPLSIQDPRKYFDAATQRATADHTQQQQQQQTGQAGASDAADAMDLDEPAAGTHATLAASLAAFGSELAAAVGRGGGSSREQSRRGGRGKGGAAAAVMAPAAAAQEVVEFGRQVAVARQGIGEAAEQSLLKQLPESLRAALLAHGEAVKELLSHFWATYPVTSAALLAKAERLRDGVSKLYDRLQKLKDGAAGANRHLLSQLLQPFFQSLDAALAQFEADKARRQQRRGQRMGAAGGRAPLAVGQR
ncbi:hypothetical protein CLOP_g2147 [Closterium sp. NIES-67]|nr:hypothetical protein CLOP_g2147 [Closterium sp. NIES-67]